MEIFYYRNNNKQPTDIVLKDKINCNDLTIVLEGEMKYILNGEKIDATMGDVLFMPKGTYRIRYAIESAHYISFNFYGDETYDIPLYSKKVVSSSIRMLCNAFDEMAKNDSDITSEKLTLLLKCIIQEIRDQVKNTNKNNVIATIKEYVHENLNEKINLEDIAKHVFLSVSHTEKIFKAETGISIIDYVLDMRIKKAKILIIQENKKIKEIATECGFQDCNYFIRTFKKRVGITPKQFKNTPSSKLVYKDVWEKN